jgi:hypothetical protein
LGAALQCLVFGFSRVLPCVCERENGGTTSRIAWREVFDLGNPIVRPGGTDGNLIPFSTLRQIFDLQRENDFILRIVQTAPHWWAVLE